MNDERDQKFASVNDAILSDDQGLMLFTDIPSCWLVVATCQLAIGSTELDPEIARAIREVSATFAAPIILRHPGAEEMIAFGWQLVEGGKHGTEN